MRDTRKHQESVAWWPMLPPRFFLDSAAFPCLCRPRRRLLSNDLEQLTRRGKKDGRGGCLIHSGLQRRYPVLLAQLHPFYSL